MGIINNREHTVNLIIILSFVAGVGLIVFFGITGQRIPENIDEYIGLILGFVFKTIADITPAKGGKK